MPLMTQDTYILNKKLEMLGFLLMDKIWCFKMLSPTNKEVMSLPIPTTTLVPELRQDIRIEYSEGRHCTNSHYLY